MVTKMTLDTLQAPRLLRRITRTLCPVLLSLLLAGVLAHTATARQNQEAFDEPENTVEKVLTEVQLALRGAQTEIVNMGMPPLSTVELTLQTVHSRRKGGILKLFIFSFGKSWEKEKAQELVLTLEPPEPITERGAANRISLADDLRAAILTAAEGVQAARTSEPPLVLTKLEVEIGFVVRTQGAGTVLLEIVPVTIELRGDLNKEAIQKIRLTFEDR